MPAAPLVGAVTTCPPAAFSSFTASAQALTHSIGSTGPIGVSASSSRFRRGARRGTFSTPGRMPSAANPRCTQACMTSQMRVSRASISASLRIARSLTRINPSIERPARSHCARSSSPLAKGSGISAAAPPPEAASDSPSRCTAPPPIEYISSASSVCPAASRAVKRMPFECPGSIWSRWNSRFIGSSKAISCRPATPEPPAPADPRERRLHHRGIELGRVVALEAEQDRAVRAVAEPGQRERAVELHEDLGRRSRAAPSPRGRARRSARRASGPSCATRTGPRRP